MQKILNKNIKSDGGLHLIISFGFYLKIFILFYILNLIFPYNREIKYSTIVTDKKSEIVYAFLSSDEKWRIMLEEDEISPKLEKALLFKEDKYFYYHPGVNIIAIFRAFVNNLSKQKRTSGASTITMQLARLQNPKERTYLNKFKEIITALRLEFSYSKKEILRMYLTLAPYGGNIEGIKAACLLYFDKLPKKMSLAEITTLAVIPNRPNSLKISPNNFELVKMRNKWLKKILKAGIFNKIEIEDALLEPISAYRRNSPKFAPQFSYRIKKENPNKAIIRTNLDLNKQIKIQKIVKNYIAGIYIRNIKNACVLIIENKTGNVISYIGSADFNNKEDAGQVDGIRAIRSPGSTLKPLLYGKAFETGLITPKFVISDVPVSYGAYEPENFDEKFHGNVTVEYALSHSLNIPAVKILDRYKLNNFINLLEKLNFKTIKKQHSSLGHSVILGGCGVSLEEQATVFTAYANEGFYKELSYLQSDTNKIGFQLLSKSANYMLTQILTTVSRPDLPSEWQNSRHLPKVAWKTGTSYGKKDAWSIGFNKKYTVAVWVGNFSSEGVPELSGARTAAPLLFQIFNTIDYNSKNDFNKLAENIDFRNVCTASGNIPSDLCSDISIDAFIPGVSPNKICTHLKEIYISADSSVSYCKTCLPENGYKKAVYRNLKPEIRSFYELTGVKYKKIPPHFPNCERIFRENSPQITSPIKNVEYFIDKIDSTKIMLSADVSPDVDTVYWYINNKFIASRRSNKKLFVIPPSGKIKISCTDDKGRNTNIFIVIKYIEGF